jgi:hypothetical protein
LRATLGDAWWLEVGNGVTSPAFVLGLATPDSPPSLNRPVEEPHGQDARLL